MGMTASYLPYDPGQALLLPPALQEWLPQGHLAYYISDTVDALDLSAFHARYAGGGPRNQPFDPAMMVKILLYAYATGVFSSRKIASKLHEDVAFRVLAAGNYPKHRTICDFRARHLNELAALFVQVVQLASPEAVLAQLAAGPTEAIVEPPNGWIKNILGLDTVRSEFKLVCLVLNLRRMSYLVPT